jgi:hypothetical protein
MDIEDPRFEAFEARFRELVEQSELVPPPRPALGSAKAYLCLYGENGLSPDEEFAVLEQLAEEAGRNLKRVEVDTDYWQNIVLFVP